MIKVHIASSRKEEIGQLCIDWAANNMPDGFELTDDMQECEIFISVLYDELLDREFLSIRRCYNFHPGLLPEFRGAGAFSWALINKEANVGITLHEIDETIDTGRIIDWMTVPINSTSTANTLFMKSMDCIHWMLRYWFRLLLTNDYKTQANDGGHLYLREDLEKAKDISHIIRAFTFKGKESAYWIDSKGQKHHVEFH